MRIKPQLWVVLLLLIGIIAVSWLNRPQRSVAPQASSSPSADTLQLGQLILQPCDIGSEHQLTEQAYCTEFEVPEDHANDHPDGNGRRIKLKVAIVKSDAAQPDSDLVTFIDGGPGGAATDDFPAVAAAAPVIRMHWTVHS
jgi:hypothetical protein